MLQQVLRGRRSSRAALAIAALFLLFPQRARSFDNSASQDAKARPANRLAKESSPYLLQHAHNPVDWYPWCTEAFAKAKREGKLVFLSIGYSSCHWCHVMERESFENPSVAKLLNQWFVCIKVDREERSDLDAIYMTALNVQGQRGGWPLSMFLTAEGRPIVGGTYWPPDDKEIDGEKTRGFKSILRIMHDWQTEQPKKLEEQADRLSAATRLALSDAARRADRAVTLNRALVDSAVNAIKEEFDKQYGGFGSPSRGFQGPKFPVPSYLQLLLYEGEHRQADTLTQMALFSLERMARGGIYDQLGGGFHRYCVDRTWTVPHFEKMLYDNAQLVEVYAEAYRLTRNPLFSRVVQETLAFIGREMTSPEGGFYSALDADSDGSEGTYYLWTSRQIDEALPAKPDATLFKKAFGADGTPNFESTAYVLVQPKTLSQVAGELSMTEQQVTERLAVLKQRLFGIRAQRPRPFLDTKVLTGWNGQMIAGYAVAGRILAEDRYIRAAARAADFVLKDLRSNAGRLLHGYAVHADGAGGARLNAYLDDYAYMGHGLLCLHDATGERRWLDEARALTDTMVQFYADKEAGGFFYTSSDHEKLFARSKDQYDSAQPSGNSVAASNLVRLWTKTGDPRYRTLAERTLKALSGYLRTNPSALTFAAAALASFLDAKGVSGEQTASAEAAVVQAGGAKKSDSVVKVTATASPDKPGSDGKQTVTVTFLIDKGWHIYANPPGLDDLVSVQTKIAVDANVKPQDVQVQYPEGKLIDDPAVGKYRVYEDTVAVKATVRRAPGDTSPLQLTVTFQSCDAKQCLLPAKVKLTVP
jgi:uncharacterized protein YyaL (SSP411 family)